MQNTLQNSMMEYNISVTCTEQKMISCIYLELFTENYLLKIAVVTEDAKFT